MIGLPLVKQRDSSELEHLRGIIRNLRSENKSLKKQLSRSQKRERQIEDDISDNDIPDSDVHDIWQEEIITPGFRCERCQSSYKPLDLGSRVLHICLNCKWTKSSRNVSDV